MSRCGLGSQAIKVTGFQIQTGLNARNGNDRPNQKDLEVNFEAVILNRLGSKVGYGGYG